MYFEKATKNWHKVSNFKTKKKIPPNFYCLLRKPELLQNLAKHKLWERTKKAVKIDPKEIVKTTNPSFAMTACFASP